MIKRYNTFVYMVYLNLRVHTPEVEKISVCMYTESNPIIRII